MARPTKASAAALRSKLKAAAAKRGRPKGAKHYEITKDRIRLSLLLGRLEKHGLGELKKMDRGQQISAMYLVDKLIPKAEAPKDINLNGTIIVRERDPTQRPPGYHRRGPASETGSV